MPNGRVCQDRLQTAIYDDVFLDPSRVAARDGGGGGGHATNAFKVLLGVSAGAYFIWASQGAHVSQCTQQHCNQLLFVCNRL
jgi:hypothetical protein